jgi:hypothetical protein
MPGYPAADTLWIAVYRNNLKQQIGNARNQLQNADLSSLIPKESQT